MRLRKNKQVTFIEFTHSYLTSEGKTLMGVTSLMKKHGLSPDYGDVPANILAAKAAAGTAAHKLLERYDDGKKVEEVNYLAAYKELGLPVMKSEYLVSDNVMVASSIDKVLKADDDNEVDLADVKTTYSVHKTAVSWQLSIYAYLFELQNPGKKVRDLYCIHVDLKSGAVNLIPIHKRPAGDVERLLECERQGILYKEDGVGDWTVDLDELTRLHEQADMLSASLAEVKKAIEVQETLLLSEMQQKGAEKACGQYASFGIKSAYTRSSLDTAAVRTKYPEVYNECVKTTEIAASVTYKLNK